MDSATPTHLQHETASGTIRGDIRAGGASLALAEIGTILYRRKWQILVMFVLIVTSVAAATFLMPNQYEAHMKILVKNERADMLVSAGSTAQSSYQGQVSETQI